jgi:endonuclease/exonuclease/phosphatase family metal-dependent hydrolase
VRVVTWNLLHRIHAMNWSEPAIEAHPDETVRIAAITAKLVSLPADVLCLQEVSGDQLASLRTAFEQVNVHTYPRVPRPRDGVRAPLADVTEHLVTIVRGSRVRQTASDTYPTDKGKGYLIVELDDIAVINTHLSFGDKHAAQCSQLVTAARGFSACVIVGDFNDDRTCCGERLGARFTPALPAIERPTRPRTDPRSKSEVIDHIFVAGCTAVDVEVLAGGGLSDHNPVTATIQRP